MSIKAEETKKMLLLKYASFAMKVVIDEDLILYYSILIITNKMYLMPYCSLPLLNIMIALQ